MVYNTKAFEAKQSPRQKPLKSKISVKFQEVDFSVSENSSVAKVYPDKIGSGNKNACNFWYSNTMVKIFFSF